MSKLYEASEITIETFQPLVGEEFALEDASAIRLIEVEKLSLGKYWNGNREAFALIFEGEHVHPMATGIRRLSHPEHQFDMSLNPVLSSSPQPGRITYEAIFS